MWANHDSGSAASARSTRADAFSHASCAGKSAQNACDTYHMPRPESAGAKSGSIRIAASKLSRLRMNPSGVKVFQWNWPRR